MKKCIFLFLISTTVMHIQAQDIIGGGARPWLFTSHPDTGILTITPTDSIGEWDRLKKIAFLPSGNVGIGTNNPDEKLTVDGTVHSKEILVDLRIPADFVFQKYYTGKSELNENYTMLSLKEIETFTKKNHHLPNIPSAKEIQKEGLHLKKMTNLLLQKVEELTLFIIEQEKRIKVLEAKVNKKSTSK